MRDYISKLNDRNLQRKRESGLTTYVLYSVLIFILYRCAIEYTFIPFQGNLENIIFIFTCVVNIIISILVMLSLHDDAIGNNSAIRFIQKTQFHNSLVEDFILYSTLAIIPMCLNLFVVYINYINGSHFAVYFFLEGIFFFSMIITNIRKLLIESKSGIKQYTIYSGTEGGQTSDKLLNFITFIILLLIIYFAITNSFLLKVNFSKTTIVIYSSMVYSIPLIILWILDLRREDSFKNSLENLEFEINVRDLKDEEIRIRLQQNYMGFLLDEWVEFNMKIINDYQNRIDIEKAEIVALNNLLLSLDKNQYPLEYQGRVTQLENSIKKFNEKNNEFLDNKIKEILEVSKGKNLGNTERMKINDIYKEYSNCKLISTLNKNNILQ